MQIEAPERALLSKESRHPFHVTLEAHGKIRLKETTGTLSKSATRVIQGLLDQSGIEVQLLCLIREEQLISRKHNLERISTAFSAQLSAIIYGWMTLFEPVGTFLQSSGFYLQHPQNCDRNVKYRNPHCLSGLDPEASMTLEKHWDTSIARQEKGESLPDLLASVDCDVDLPETMGSPDLVTSLHRQVIPKNLKISLTIVDIRKRRYHSC